MALYIIRDGAFTLTKGRPGSNLLHYEVFGKRYLDSFDDVYIVGRLFENEDSTALAVEGESVNFIPLPGKRGVRGAFSIFFSVVRFALSNVKKGDAFLLRIPGTVSSIVFFILLFKKIPFAVEVAADPFDSYSPKALGGHVLSHLVQRLFVWLVKLQCKYADSSVYVTDYSLQKRYPPGKRSASYSVTSIDLQPNAFAQRAKTTNELNLTAPHIVLTGNMQGRMKGHDILIRALAKTREYGFDARLTIIGFGDNANFYKNMCAKYNVEKFVNFAGKLSSGEPVRRVLRSADLFVLPSRQEGLPRALLEAMALGLPAVATRVGGVPELLDEDAIVPPDSVEALSDKIIEMLSSPKQIALQASKNYSKAKKYRAEVVRKKRSAFLDNLKAISEE